MILVKFVNFSGLSSNVVVSIFLAHFVCFKNLSKPSTTFSFILLMFSRILGDKYRLISFIGVSAGFNLGVRGALKISLTPSKY
jgi:hypothetical protein